MIPAGVGAVTTFAIVLSHPDLGRILQAAPVIQIHLLAATAAFGLGLVMMATRKGRTFHRIAGWTWVALLLLVSISSLFIMEFTPGRWSIIHIITSAALIMVTLAVVAARRHDVKRHRLLMTLLVYWILAGSATATLIPGRLMSAVFFGG
jgi:uncharacterized membrane protein